MDLSQLITLLIALLSSGGVIYLIFDKLLLSKKEKVEVNKDILGNGALMIDLYRQIDEIVTTKTRPLEEKIDNLSHMLDKWACYRNPEECNNRLSRPVCRDQQ